MNLIKRSQQVLLVILLLNLISTWLHYTDNALFLDKYSGPEWFTTSGVFIAVIVMTPIGLFGYWLYTKGMMGLSYLLLCMYSTTSISSPGHYLFPIVTPMALKMHGLIWLDGIARILLICFVVWSSLITQEWRRPKILEQ